MSPQEWPRWPKSTIKRRTHVMMSSLFFVFDSMLEVASTERGRAEVNLSLKQVLTLRLEVGGYK